MGRWYLDKKDETNDYLQLRLSSLKKDGFLEPGNQYYGVTVTWTRGTSQNKSSIGLTIDTTEVNEHIQLNYTYTENSSGEKIDMDYRINLATTSCNYGGKRYWFICPLTKNGQYCGRRVGVLYGGKWFGCRHCYNLTYESRNESKSSRLYPLFAVLDGYKREEELEKEIKRRFYDGRPTRKMRQLMKHRMKTLQYVPMVNRISKEGF